MMTDRLQQRLNRSYVTDLIEDPEIHPFRALLLGFALDTGDPDQDIDLWEQWDSKPTSPANPNSLTTRKGPHQ